MRLFLAVKIPMDSGFYDLYRGLKGLSRYLRPVDPEKQHITLKFLGDPGTTHDDVARAVSGIGGKHGPFEMRPEDSGAFPNWKRPSVLWIGLRPVEPLRELAEDIDSELHEKIGTDLERRKFRGHITVARCKGRGPFDTIAARSLMEEALKGFRERDYLIMVDRFHLINSTLTPNGPVYRTLSSFELDRGRE
jgi:2'-5' RNA ligase